MSKTCFVIMPFGQKVDADGQEIDFEKIYKFLIKEAVEGFEGLQCLRCDEIEKSGSIHHEMFRHIVEDPVAIVDTSTLNANVFYELGVRHAQRESVTVIIHRKGTQWPFNIAGLKRIDYDTTDLESVSEAKQKIRNFIKNGLQQDSEPDSLVHQVIAGLKGRGAQAISQFGLYEYSLRDNPEKRVGFVTGDRQSITIGDVWVNSENTNMQMDRYFGKSTSATIRYLGAKKHPVSGRVLEDTIAEELAQLMAGERYVAPGKVIATGPGELEKNNVKLIFHVASVQGEPREGYHPIQNIGRCVSNALALTESSEFQDQKLTSILFPIFGTGPGGGSLDEHLQIFLDVAVDYLETHPESPMESIYFYAWSDVALKICQGVAGKHPALTAATTD